MERYSTIHSYAHAVASSRGNPEATQNPTAEVLKPKPISFCSSEHTGLTYTLSNTLPFAPTPLFCSKHAKRKSCIIH